MPSYFEDRDSANDRYSLFEREFQPTDGGTGHEWAGAEGFDAPRVSVVDGLRLHHGIPTGRIGSSTRQIVLPCENSRPLVIDDTSAAVNTLLVGRTRSGKTTVAKHILNGLSGGANGTRIMSDEDICVVLDVTGEYAALFGRPQDMVIGGKGSSESATWNLFADLRFGDAETREYIRNAVGKLLFEKNREHPGANPFFTQGSRDLFDGVMRLLMKEPDADNALLVELWKQITPQRLYEMLRSNEDTFSLADYVNPSAPSQAYGLLGSLTPVVKDVFQGSFARRGTLSIREQLRKKGGRILFLDFPVSTGATLGAGFRILVDLAIREAIAIGEEERRGTGEVKGRCFFLVDEASRLGGPLLHLEEGLNTGSQLGLRFILGMQSHMQLFEAFGTNASSILAGLNNVFAFNCTESETKDFVKRRCGRCTKRLVLKNAGMGDPLQPVFEADVCGDRDIWDLRPGEAIVIMPGTLAPFKVRFCDFEAGRGQPGKR